MRSIKSTRCARCAITTATPAKPRFKPKASTWALSRKKLRWVFPEWVSEGEDGYLLLSMRGFEAVAVRAMQELSAENALLKADAVAVTAEVAALKAELAAQSSRLQALEAERQ